MKASLGSGGVNTPNKFQKQRVNNYDSSPYTDHEAQPSFSLSCDWKNVNSQLFNFQFLIERIPHWNNRLFMSLILPAVNIQHFLSSSFVKHLTIVRCSEIYSLEVRWMNIFQVIYSPPPSPFPPLVVLLMVIIILSVFEVSRVSCVFWFYWVSLFRLPWIIAPSHQYR